MELKNMTDKELNELKNKINTELDNRDNIKKKDFENKLTDLIQDIMSEGYTINIVGYSESYGYDTAIMIDEYWSNFDLSIE